MSGFIPCDISGLEKKVHESCLTDVSPKLPSLGLVNCRSFPPTQTVSRPPSLSTRVFLPAIIAVMTWGRYHGGRRPSSNDSFHSPTVIPPSALDKPSITERYHRRRTMRGGVTTCSPTMVMLHVTRFVECRWWNDGCRGRTYSKKLRFLRKKEQATQI